MNLGKKLMSSAGTGKDKLVKLLAEKNKKNISGNLAKDLLKIGTGLKDVQRVGGNVAQKIAGKLSKSARSSALKKKYQ
jgi:hypothetical protein